MSTISPDKKLEKRLNIVAWVLTAIVFILMVFMRRVKLDLGMDLSFLPGLNAILNSSVAVILILAYRMIKKGNKDAHRKLIYLAIGLSALFLLSYVLYHFTTVEVSFGGEGFIRYVYFILLILHIISAAIIFPFILLTFIRAYTNQFERHKKIARWVWPVWLFVAVSGPVCYLLLMPYY